jgi:hypothetical protein
MIDRAILQQLKATAPRTEATFSPGSWDDETNSVGVVCYTGAEVARYSWDEGEFFLSFDMGGMDLSRYNGGAAVLIDHADYSLKSQIGKIVEGSAKIEDGKLMARVAFSVNPMHAGMVADIKAGILKHVSIGVEIDPEALEYLSKKGVAKAERTHIRARKSTPYELSFVPVPANVGAQTFAAAQRPAGDPPMSTTYQPTQEDLAKIKSQTLAELKERRRAILEAARIVTPLGTEGTKLAEDLIDDESVTVDQARTKLIDARATWDEKMSVNGQKGTGVKPGADNDGKLGKLAAKALAQRMGATGKLVQLTDDEHRAVEERFGDLDPRRMAERVLTEKGVKFGNLSDEQTLGRAFELCDVRRGISRYRESFNRRERLGEIGTADLPILLGSASELTILDAYQNTPTTYQAWCAVKSLPDFRDGYKAVDFSRLPDLEEIGESGKLVEGTVNEGGEPLVLKEWGRKLSWSRRAIVNDKWGMMGAIAASLGRRVAVKRNAKAYAKLVENPALTSVSTNTVFHANHGNVGSTAALSATTLGELRKLIREQKGMHDKEGSISASNGMRLNLPMRTLVVGSAKEFAAEQLIAGAYIPTAASTAMTPSLRSVQLVADAEISSTTAFYGFADPSIAPCFMETVLGDEGILSEMLYDEETLGVKLHCRIAFNVQAVNFRGAAYNAGA